MPRGFLYKVMYYYKTKYGVYVPMVYITTLQFYIHISRYYSKYGAVE